MKTSDRGIEFIKSYEKLRTMPYRDSGNQWTVGYGHLILPGENFDNGITAIAADDLFIDDLEKKAEQPIEDCVAVQISQSEFDALASLCFNIGLGNFSKSTLVKLLNAGDHIERVALEFGKWNHDHGQVVAGLTFRRAAETEIFLHGNYVNHV